MVTARIGKKATDPVSTAYFGMGLTSVSTNSSRISLSAGLHTMSVFTFSCRPFQTKAPLLTSTTPRAHAPFTEAISFSPPIFKIIDLGNEQHTSLYQLAQFIGNDEIRLPDHIELETI